MSPLHNGGLHQVRAQHNDATAVRARQALLSTVCHRGDAEAITQIIHDDCVARVGRAVSGARASGSSTIDVVEAVARYVPVTLGHRYLGVPVAPRPGSFELTSEMLSYYGTAIDGRPETALRREDGIIPDERQMYRWIKAAFQHFFNNVQKDPVVQVEGLRSCRQLLAHILREIGIQRQRLLDGERVDDTMLTRLLHFQLGRSTPTVQRPADLDPRLVTDLRIAENVMGTIVGAVAGQEEATCRVIDSLIRLQEGSIEPADGAVSLRQLCRGHAAALNVMNGTRVAESRADLRSTLLEALRLQPQGEVLCGMAHDGSRIADSRRSPPARSCSRRTFGHERRART